MTHPFFIALFIVSILGPVLAGLLAMVMGKSASANRPAQTIFAVSAAAGLLAALVIVWDTVVGGAVPVIASLSFLSAFDFRLDALAGCFLAFVNTGVLLSSLFALGYLPRYASTYSLPSLNFASALFIIGMQATVLSSSVLAFLFFWEVMSISAYFLVIADREDASLRAGLLYLVMTHLGFACLLVGLFVLSHGDPTATFATLSANALTLPLSSLGISFFFLLAGFGSKAGLVPLHQWLPAAHPQAPSNSSALMSGVMLKVALYGFLRFVVGMMPAVPLLWSSVVVVAGVLSALFGVLHASVENDLKRLLAWSSIENMGIIFTSVGLALAFRTLGLSMTPFLVVALVHALNHMIFKSGLFLSAGAIISETHTRDMNAMGGLAKAWPSFSGWFLGLVFAAAALPPLGTFYGEWMLFQHIGSIIAIAPVSTAIVLGVIMAALALVGGLAIFTFANVFTAVFLSRPRSEHAAHVKPLPALLALPAAACTVASLGVALAIEPIRSLLSHMLEQGTSLSAHTSLVVSDGSISPVLIALVACVLAVVLIIARRSFANRAVRITGTWDCGQAITPRMEYTPTGFTAPIRFFFRSILLSKHHMHTQRVAPENAWVLKRRLEWSTHSIWEEWVYRPLARGLFRASNVVKRLQSGVVQFYLLLIFVTLVIVLVVAL